ncbi:unnamed protein product [Dovyalis caffra]|uniref:Uncharacterized protein n=1 Tax=Dovyalis caffra TaxID=77055 RepID=A0AAV1R435_9ROSI|nr:unnamed protein product [Dovyalis caffra]
MDNGSPYSDEETTAILLYPMLIQSCSSHRSIHHSYRHADNPPSTATMPFIPLIVALHANPKNRNSPSTTLIVDYSSRLTDQQSCSRSNASSPTIMSSSIDRR